MKQKKTIFKNWLFHLEGIERDKPNAFTSFSVAIEKFKTEFFKALKIPEIVEWISNRLK